MTHMKVEGCFNLRAPFFTLVVIILPDYGCNQCSQYVLEIVIVPL